MAQGQVRVNIKGDRSPTSPITTASRSSIYPSDTPLFYHEESTTSGPIATSPKSSTFERTLPRRRRTLTQHETASPVTPFKTTIENHLQSLSLVEKAHMTRKRSSKWFIPFALFTSLVFLFYITSRAPNAEHPKTRAYQYVPWKWPTRVENYDFKTQPSERQCYDGTVERYNDPSASKEIPRIVHFTWGLKGDGAFNFAFALAIKAAIKAIRPDEIKVHYTNLDKNNEFYRSLEQNITMVYHDPKDYFSAAGFDDKLDIRNWHVAHVADVLRLVILKQEGGIYLDSDAYALHSFDNILAGARDVVMAHEGGNRYGMANAVVVAKKNATFIERWLGEYATSFDPNDWNGHSVVLPKKLSLLHPLEICVLSPTSFFWPLWTEAHVDYMHTPLSPMEAAVVKDRVSNYGGRLYEDQLCYHAWSHNSMEKYIQHLTSEKIRNEDTRFNVLMRQFLD